MTATLTKRQVRRLRAKEFAKRRNIAVAFVAGEVLIDFPLHVKREEFVCDVVNALRPTDVQIEGDQLWLAWD